MQYVIEGLSPLPRLLWVGVEGWNCGKRCAQDSLLGIGQEWSHCMFVETAVDFVL